MNRLCIIPCGAKKIWDVPGVAPAGYAAQLAYLSPLHQKCQAYARLFFTDWVILSAKHGFLLPEDDVPGNYNVAFGSDHPEMMTAEALAAQLRRKALDRFDEVVVLGGRKFQRIVPAVFPSGARFVYPLVGSKGIGHMLQRLNEALRERTELK